MGDNGESGRGHRDPLRLVTQEEKRQMEEAAQGHPWSLTFGEFLRKVTSELGFRLHALDATAPGGHPSRIRMRYLKDDAEDRIVVLPGLDDGDQLDPATTASLCRQIRIPTELFGLPAEEPSADSDTLL